MLQSTEHITNYMSWAFLEKPQAANCAATEELPNISYKPKVYYHVHMSPPLVHIQSQINPVHTNPFSLSKINLYINHLRLGLPSGLFPTGLPTNILDAFHLF
jgi:hypothetical protein